MQVVGYFFLLFFPSFQLWKWHPIYKCTYINIYKLNICQHDDFRIFSFIHTFLNRYTQVKNSSIFISPYPDIYLLQNIYELLDIYLLSVAEEYYIPTQYINLMIKLLTIFLWVCVLCVIYSLGVTQTLCWTSCSLCWTA